jgi:hypothetical protein
LAQRGCRIPQNEEAGPNTRTKRRPVAISDPPRRKTGPRVFAGWEFVADRLLAPVTSRTCWWNLLRPDIEWMQAAGPEDGTTPAHRDCDTQDHSRPADAFGRSAEHAAPRIMNGIEEGDAAKAWIRLLAPGPVVELTGMDWTRRSRTGRLVVV